MAGDNEIKTTKTQVRQPMLAVPNAMPTMALAGLAGKAAGLTVPAPEVPTASPEELKQKAGAPTPAAEPKRGPDQGAPTEKVPQKPRGRILKPADGGPEVVQLGPMTVLEIENLSLRLQVVKRDKQIATTALLEVERKQRELDIEQRKLMAKVSQQIGKPILGNLRLVNKEKGLCQIEG